MKSKRKRWYCLFVAMLVVAAIYVWPRHGPSTITQENADRIKEGMTRAEVEAVLGPARNETGRRFFHYALWGNLVARTAYSPHWVTEDLLVCVCLDKEERVIAVYCQEKPSLASDSSWERIKAFLSF